MESEVELELTGTGVAPVAGEGVTSPFTRKLRIVIVSSFYSEGMGYSENCLSRALARRGHDVHVVTSTFNVYGNEPLYEETYSSFLGPASVAAGTRVVDGYHVHRLPTKLVAGYVRLQGLTRVVRSLAPDVVHSLEVASLQTFELAAARPFSRYKLFCETHQNLSVIRPYMRERAGSPLRRAFYRLTRTLPSHLASRMAERVYAVSADCVEVASRFYGVTPSRVRLLPLGTDTETFHPVSGQTERQARQALRARYGYTDHDIVCIYTGRFSSGKNPLVLARAIDELSREDPRYKGLFVGNGGQMSDIVSCRNVTTVPFMTHRELAAHYRAADVAVWPRQESMSMLDATASSLPLVVSDRIGEPARVEGNGRMYVEDSVESLVAVLRELASPDTRANLGRVGRARVETGTSWTSFARELERDFLDAIEPRPSSPGALGQP